ncbi:unnamed protein product, partial [Prorocentrum cordatum]
VQNVGHYSERLRYSAAHEAPIKPRGSALKCAVSGGVTASPQDSEIPKAPFPEVPKSMCDGDWSLVMSQKWARKEAQVVLEARSLVLAVKHIVRSTQNFGRKHLVLNDCMAPILAVTKGRSSCPGMLQCCRQIAALLAASNCYVGWRPSAMASSATISAACLQLMPVALAARAGGLAASSPRGPSGRRPCREWVPLGPGASEQQAAARAWASPTVAGAPVTASEPSFLELQSVTPKAAADYQSCVKICHVWCLHRGGVGDLATLLTSAPDIDLALATYMQEKFCQGEFAYVPTKLMAGLRYFWTFPHGWPLGLPRSARALAGWRRMAPARSRLPCLWIALCLCMQHMIGAGLVMEAVACAITFVFYLRPSECLRLKGKLSTPPAAAGRRQQGDASQMWSILLRPQEGGDASKTEYVDESLLADDPLFPWPPQVPASLKAKFPNNVLVFSLGQAAWGRALKTVSVAVGMGALGEPTLYRLRRVGVSHDLLFKVRPLLTAKKRGRWASDRSLVRYEKGGRFNEQLNALDQTLLLAAEDATSKIGVALVSACRA